MKLLSYLIFAFILISFSSCLQEKKQQIEIRNDFLSEIGQSSEYANWKSKAELAQDALMNFNFSEFRAFLEENNVDQSSTSTEDLLLQVEHIRGADAYILATNEMVDALNKLNEVFPDYRELDRNSKLIVLQAYQDHIGFDPITEITPSPSVID